MRTFQQPGAVMQKDTSDGIDELLDIFAKVLEEAAAAARARDIKLLTLRMDEVTELAKLIANGPFV